MVRRRRHADVRRCPGELRQSGGERRKVVESSGGVGRIEAAGVVAQIGRGGSRLEEDASALSRYGWAPTMVISRRSRSATPSSPASRSQVPCSVAVLALLASFAGCERKPKGTTEDAPAARPVASSAPAANPTAADTMATGPTATTEPSPSGLPPVARGASLSEDAVLKVVNPKHTPAYTGPTGKVRGFVTVTGDAPPEFPEALRRIPTKCLGAQETFTRAYRQGADRRLADVLVAVTGYKGYLPARGDAVLVEGRDCAWNTRTVAVTYGQRIDIVSRDDNTYAPELMGQPWPVQLLATPKGDPVFVAPARPGQYLLVDGMRLFNAADVYVLAYPTFDVTGLDGTFEVDGIPPGPVKVNAILPITGATAGKEVTVVADQTVEVQLEIAFDSEAFKKTAEERVRLFSTKPGAKASSSGAAN